MSVRRSFPGNSEPFLSVPGSRNKDTWTRKTEDSNRIKRFSTSFILGLDTTASSSFFSQLFEYKYSFSCRSMLFLSNFWYHKLKMQVDKVNDELFFWIYIYVSSIMKLYVARSFVLSRNQSHLRFFPWRVRIFSNQLF